MADSRPTVIFLMGPTASGKTDLAIALREHLPVELISVDSALVIAVWISAVQSLRQKNWLQFRTG